MRLDPDAVRRAVGDLAGRLGLGLEEAGEGILTIVNANMANALGADGAIDEGGDRAVAPRHDAQIGHRREVKVRAATNGANTAWLTQQRRNH